MPATVTRLYYVQGKVQGVFFRASAARVARGLGVEGYARNMPDGRVEILAVGSESAVDQLSHWLAKGPPMARVDKVECSSAAYDPATYSPGEFTTA